MLKIFPKIKTLFFSFLFLIFSNTAFANIATVNPISIDPNSLTAFSGVTTTNAPTRASVGDFNCDGVNDIMIAAPSYSGGKGRLYVFFGPGLSSSTLASGNADVAIKGDYSGNGIGANSFFYDVNEDGCDDIITYAVRQIPAYSRLHVIPGSTVWDAGFDDTLTAIPTTFPGYNYSTLEHPASEGYGYLHLLGPLDGDVTGDGNVTNGDNYLAVCSGYTSKCMLMPVANLLTASNFVSASNYYVNSTDPSESTTSGDLDNDGFDDLIFANPDTGIAEDSVSVIFGPLATSPSKLTGSPLVNLPSEYFTSGNILGNDIQIRNADPSREDFGWYVETAKLFGTDSDDLVIGTPFEDCGPATQAGRFHLISSASLIALRDSISTSSGIVIYSDTLSGTYNYNDIDVLLLGGDTNNARFAFNENGHLGGDYNGDGVVDPVLGGSTYYNPGTAAGVMHVIFGGNLEASLGNEFHLGSGFTNSNYMILGDSGDGLGQFVTSGDVTGDGLDDLLILRPGAGFGTIVVWEGVLTDLDNDGVDSNVDCDEFDNAVSAPQVFYQDGDGDGFGNLGVPSASVCTAPANFVNNSDDCDDTNAAVNPGATEICDSLDNNCALGVDEGLPTNSYYTDNDGDGVGAGSAFVTCQVNPTGYVISNTDCDDSNAGIFPSASEICDNVDNNCSGTIDEGLTTYTYYIDNDSDGAGLATATTTTCLASAPTGYVTNSNDCNDSNAGLITPIGYYADTDGDGFGNATAVSAFCALSAPTGYTADATDCNDSSDNTHPGATETCDGIDNNCNGTTDDGVSYVDYYPDADGDGFGSTSSPQVACEQPTGYVSNNTDCNDALYDLSNNCTPVVVDDDNDGFSVAAGDCNDNNNLVFPGAGEYCDSIDNNCDGTVDEDSSLDALTWFEDADNDGFGSASSPQAACEQPTGYVNNNTDCDDTAYSAANDCSPVVVGDDDEDGVTVADGDCNDGNATIYPGAPELADTLDNDCDNQFDEFMMQLRATSGTTINAIGVKSGGDSFNISLVANNASGFTSFSAQVYMLEDSYQTLTNSNSGAWFTLGKRQVRASLSPTTYTCGTNNQDCDLIGNQNVVLSNNGSDISFSVNATIPTKIADGSYGVFVKLYGTTADGNQILLKTVSPYGYTTLSQIWNAFGNVPDFFDANGNGSLDPGEVSNLIAVVQ